jgi:DNA-binding IscR family transcriptional regulator
MKNSIEYNLAMRPGDQRVLAFLSRTGEATVSTLNAIAEALKLPEAAVQDSLERLAKDGLVSSHGRDTVVWMSRQQSG